MRYLLLPAGGYSNSEADYLPMASRAQIDEFIDKNRYGLPFAGGWVYEVPTGKTSKSWIKHLAKNHDPYPDYVVEYQGNGKVGWSRA